MEIDRDKYLRDLAARRGNGLVKVVTGARRAGKSYLLFKLYATMSSPRSPSPMRRRPSRRRCRYWASTTRSRRSS